MMSGKRPDRRRERTFQLLSGALMELLKERDFANITIQDIADKANVSRATFYLHFKDKDELLFKSMERIYDSLSEQFRQVSRDAFANKTYIHTADEALEFKHVAAHADFYRAMFGAHGSPQFMQMVRAYLQNAARREILEPLAPPDGAAFPLDFMAAFMAGAEIGVLTWWLESGLKLPPEEVCAMMNAFCLFGMAWALRLPIDPNDLPT